MFLFLKKLFFQITCGIFTRTKDNHDFSRFPITEKYSIISLKFYKNRIYNFLLWTKNTAIFILHINKFYKSYLLLSDDESKKLFIKLIVYKILGPKHVKIKDNLDWKKEQELINHADKFYTSPSEILLKTHPLFGGLNHYQNIPTERGHIKLDCWTGGITYGSMKKQYYFSRHGVVIMPELGDVVIDAGGCFGDTSVFFSKSAGTTGKVYVFDPLSIHGTVINKNIAQNNLSDQITYLPYALGEKSNDTKPGESVNCDLNPGFRMTDNTSFPIKCIDDFVQENNINIMNYIKMDIEGYELLALKGAIQTIQKFKPKLAISIYDKREDFYAIPLWIKKISESYNFYIDHYTMHAEETVLYAIHKN